MSQSNHLTRIDGLLCLDAKLGITMSSEKGGISLVSKDNNSFLVMETKNLAILQAGDNSVSIYEDENNGGMVDIQADAKGAVNLAIQDGAKQNTALTITNGDTHLGVFGPGQFNRVHVEKDKISIESSAGAANLAAKKLGMVEVTPTKVTIKCLDSTMTLDVNGFTFEPAARTIALKLTTSEFSVVAQNGSALKMDLISGEVSIKGLKVAVSSTIETAIKTLESEIQVKIDGISSTAVTRRELTDAVATAKATLEQTTIKGISDRVAALEQLKPGCWVARAVFGETDIRWRLFRHWLFGDRFHPEQATWLQRIYLRHGPWVAEVVRRCPPLRWALYLCMSHCIRGLHTVPHLAFGRASVSAPLSLSHNL